MKLLNDPIFGKAFTIVNTKNTAITAGSGSLPVFATPFMIALMEEATCNAISDSLDDCETTVGTRIDVTHDRASAAGTVITASARLVDTDGRRLVFEVCAKDEQEHIIGKGTIERFVALSEKFMKKVEESNV